MLQGIKARALLSGVRGQAGVDQAALADVLLRVSRLLADHPEIAELDLNPVIAYPDGARVVDARVRVAKG
jgi:acetyltransferase